MGEGGADPSANAEILLATDFHDGIPFPHIPIPHAGIHAVRKLFRINFRITVTVRPLEVINYFQITFKIRKLILASYIEIQLQQESRKNPAKFQQSVQQEQRSTSGPAGVQQGPSKVHQGPAPKLHQTSSDTRHQTTPENKAPKLKIPRVREDSASSRR